MILNEIKCHVNTFLGLVGGCIPCIPPCLRAWSHPPEMQSVLLMPVKIITIIITRLYCNNVKSNHIIRFSKINENRIVP